MLAYASSCDVDNPKLGTLVRIQSGVGFPHAYQGEQDGTFPFYKVGSLAKVGRDGTIQDDSHTVEPGVAEKLGAKIIPAGSTLLAKIGAALLLGRFVPTSKDCCIDNNMLALIPGPQVHDRYLTYACSLIDVATLERSGPVPTLDVEGLRQIRIPLPDLETQRAIADYLDHETAEIDAMSADLDEMESLLTERRGATVEKLLLGGGTPELEGLPEGWSRTTLGAVFSFHNGDRGVHYPRPEEIKDEGIPFINAGDLINGSVDLEGCKRVSPEKYAQMGGAKLRRGDILFCLRGSLGKRGLMESDGGSLASSLCALRNERPDFVDARYIAHAMSTRVLSLQIWFNESGSAQPNLGAEQVARFRVPLPPLEEQHRIVDEIDRETAEIDAMLADITELRDLLTERRAAVIAAAVTGQIDIPTAEEPTHA